MRNKYVISLFLGLFACPFFLVAQTPHKALREGDRQYEKKEYKWAEQAYELAGDEPKALYNKGNALYRQGQYEPAGELYQEALERTTDPGHKADAYHNLGNTQLQQQQFQKAVESYQNSLRLRPGDPDAKTNLQLAKKKLEEQRQQEQEQKPNEGSDQDENEKQGDDQENQDQNQDQGQKNQPNSSSSQGNQPSDPQQLSPEEARRLLESAVGPEDMKNTRKYRQRGLPPPKPGIKKDW
ncbi:MAG: tetratricopeptide repeat protein [Saprospiraceae bacterium]